MKSQFVMLALLAQTISSCNLTNGNMPQGGMMNLPSSDSYLLDAADSMADDSAVANNSVGSSVSDDLQDARLQEMATRLMDVADADKSGSLTVDEFLAGPEKIRKQFDGGKTPDDSQREKIKAKLTEEFAKYAGSDSLMSRDEVVVFLAASAPRVSHHREHGPGSGPSGNRNHGKPERPEHGAPGGHPQETYEDVIAKYDANKDGVLSKEEFDAYMAARHPKHQ